MFVSVTDDVGVGVGDGQMAVHPLLVLDSVVDRVVVSAEDDATVAVLCDVFVSVLEILADQKPNSSVIPTNECQDWWFVSCEVSVPLFASPRWLTAYTAYYNNLRSHQTLNNQPPAKHLEGSI